MRVHSSATVLLAVTFAAGCSDILSSRGTRDDYALNAVRLEGRLLALGAPVPYAYVEATDDTAARMQGNDCGLSSGRLPGEPIAFATTDSTGRFAMNLQTITGALCVRLRATGRISGATLPPFLVDRALDRLVVRRETAPGVARDTIRIDLELPE